MRSKTALWFECKIRYEKMTDDGLKKKVTEQYVVNALSFTEAEARITEEASQYISGGFEVKDIKQAPYKEVFFMGWGEKVLANGTEDLMRAVRKGDKEEGRKVYDRSLEEDMERTDTKWYKAKLQFITIDERTAKEKRSNVTYLVQGCSLRNALDNIDQVMQGTMTDYVQANVGETQIIDVFEDTAAEAGAGRLIAKMCDELRDPSKSVEEIADKYVTFKTPELRQEFIDKLTGMREKNNATD